MSMRPPIKQAAYEILKRAGKPIHISEITRLVQRKVSIKSKTPEKTVNCALQRHEKIVRVGKGTFTISD